MSNTLFDRLVEASGLSPVFAGLAMRHAVEQAGFRVETLTPAELEAAMPRIEKTLKIYLGAGTSDAVGRIRALAR